MEQAGIKQIELELTINAPREHVWQCLYDHFSEWWPADFLCLAGSGGIRIEPFAGGRVWEETPEGQHLMWAHVAAINPGRSMEFIGHMTPAYGGPSVTMWSMSLNDGENGTTRFRLTDAILGRIQDDHQQNLTKGWTYLFESFKAFCETK